MKVVTKGVYFLFDDKQLVYIGESDNIYRRIGQHIYEGTKNLIRLKYFRATTEKSWKAF